MKVNSNSKRVITLLLSSLAILNLSGCNMLGFMDSPSGDAQLLEAARDCLDQGKYACAQTDYQALSNSYADVKISEGNLNTLASNDIFFMSDLFKAVGSGKGDSSSIVTMAIALAARGAFAGTTFNTIQTTYTSDNAIVDPTLQAFSQLMSSMAMFSAILATQVSSGTLTAASLVASPTACKAATCVTDGAGANVCGAGTGLDLHAGDGDGITGDCSGATACMTGTWTGAASFNKLANAGNAASKAVGTLTQGGGGGGILGVFSQLAALNGVPNCQRQALLGILFP